MVVFEILAVECVYGMILETVYLIVFLTFVSC